MSNLDLTARIALDARRWTQGLGVAGRGLRGFADGAKREMGALRNAFGTVTGQLAAFGATASAVGSVMQSAKLDQALVQVKQTAGLTAVQMANLRKEYFRMAREHGTNVDSLLSGTNALAAGGLGYTDILSSIEAVNVAMGVTKLQAEQLVEPLLAIREHFGIALGDGGAMMLLDKMRVGGKAGVIEIENLSSVLASSADEARKANFSIDQTIALIEGLGTATTKDRVGNLVNSTLRIFTNDRYMRNAQKATGVSFWDKEGARRDPMAVLQDMQAAYAKLNTEQKRARFISRAFGEADLDSIKGIGVALKEGKLDQVLKIAQDVAQSGGVFKSEITEATANAADQAGRLRATLRQAADEFAQPINDAFTKATTFALKSKSEGGMGMTGGQMLAAGGGAVALTYLLSRLPGWLGKGSSLAGGVATGNVLQEMGVTPVYVTGAAPGVFAGGGVGGAVGAAPTSKLGKTVQAVAGVGVAMYGGWEAGKFISDQLLTDRGAFGSKVGGEIGDTIGMVMARVMSPFSEEARNALRMQGQSQSEMGKLVNAMTPMTSVLNRLLGHPDDKELRGQIDINIDSQGRASVNHIKGNRQGVEIRAHTGRATAGRGGASGGW